MGLKESTFGTGYGLLFTGFGLIAFFLYTTDIEVIERLYIFSICILVAVIINTISCITLLVGLHTGRRKCVLAFLIIETFLIFTCGAATVTISAVSDHFNYHILILILAGFGLLVTVARYYLEMEIAALNYVRQRNES